MNRILTSRRTCLRFAFASVAGSIGASSGAQTAARYPLRPIRMVVPFAPGGAIDNMARPVAGAMGHELGQAVIVENRAGAAGNIGAMAVSKSPPDGYTLLVGTSATHGANPALFAKMPYDALTDFEPLSLWGSVPNVLVVNAVQGPKTLREFVEHARRKPGTLTFGSAGTGTSLHLSGVLFEKAAGVDLLHVPYKGAGPALMDLLGGTIDMMFDTVSDALPSIRSGKLRALAVAAPQRHFALPEVATFAELGYKGVEAGTWAGLFAPKGTPAPVLEQLRNVQAKVLADKQVQAAFRLDGVQLAAWQGEQFRGFIAGEVRRWAQVVREANITPE